MLFLAISALIAGPSLGIAGVLNAQIITQFARTWAPLSKRLVVIDPEFDPQNIVGLVQQLQQMTATDGSDSVLDNAVKLDGYANFESWAKTATLIIRAAQWAKNPPDAADIDDLIASIDADQEQAKDEKTALIADLKTAVESARLDKPDQADIDIAKHLLPLLEPVLWQE
jgi:hypothetical protein